MPSQVSTFKLVGDVVVLRGTFSSLAEASAHLPQGGYTTLRTYGGDRIVGLADHVTRLATSAPPAGPSLPLDASMVRTAIAGALRAAHHPESRLRLTYAPPRLFVSVEAFVPLPERLYDEGVGCVTTPVHRDNPRSKDTRFIAAASRAYASLPAGIHEALMVAPDGSILEGLSSNFFAVHRGVLRSEEQRALPGLTRALVLEAASGLVPLSPRPVRTSDLPEVSECFLTSASRDVLPVVRIDDTSIGNGRPGSVARGLLRRYRAAVELRAVSVVEGWT